MRFPSVEFHRVSNLVSGVEVPVLCIFRLPSVMNRTAMWKSCKLEFESWFVEILDLQHGFFHLQHASGFFATLRDLQHFEISNTSRSPKVLYSTIEIPRVWCAEVVTVDYPHFVFAKHPFSKFVADRLKKSDLRMWHGSKRFSVLSNAPI